VPYHIPAGLCYPCQVVLEDMKTGQKIAFDDATDETTLIAQMEAMSDVDFEGWRLFGWGAGSTLGPVCDIERA